MKLKIYQIKKEPQLQQKFLFTRLSWLENGIKDVDINNYNMVYENEYHDTVHKDVMGILEYIYTIFNISRPEAFKGHSLSISDIVELDGERYFCDSIGFVKL